MKYVLKNIFAILRGNIICAWNFLFGKCKYKNPVRVFHGADISVDRGGRLLLGKGVAIGARSQCTVRRGATLKMGNMSSLNSDCKLVCREKIEIGENTIFGPNVLVYDHDHLFDTATGVKRKEYKTGEVVIGKNCWIGANSVILRGTHIGDNSVVGAGSVVKGDYPAGSKIVQKRPQNTGGGYMRIFVATDVNIVISDGKILANGKHSTILRRYYNAFGPIVLCARYGALEGNLKGLNDISDIVCSVVEIGSLAKMLLGKCNKKMEEAMKDCDLVVGRCPGFAAYRAFDIAKKLKIPFYAESMGCAWDAYFNHGLSGKIIAPYMFFKMKKVVRNADYALYVTSEFLQKRYPCKNESIAASNVLISSLDEGALEKRIERIKNSGGESEITLMTTAALNVRYKGQQYGIRSIPKLNELGVRVKYILVGEDDDTFLRGEAERLGVSSQVEFRGRLPLDEVFTLLDKADIYIQPSLQEGLPRSVIEAMSRGCACIGARTAGIPELLEDKFVVRRKSVSDIVTLVHNYAGLDTKEKIRIAKRNFDEAKKYEASVLDNRRNAYYEKVKNELKLDGVKVC